MLVLGSWSHFTHWPGRNDNIWFIFWFDSKDMVVNWVGKHGAHCHLWLTEGGDNNNYYYYYYWTFKSACQLMPVGSKSIFSNKSNRVYHLHLSSWCVNLNAQHQLMWKLHLHEHEYHFITALCALCSVMRIHFKAPLKAKHFKTFCSEKSHVDCVLLFN